MSLDELWEIYRDQGYVGMREATPSGAYDHFYLALLAFGENDIENAVTFVHQAAECQPNNLVFTQATIYLDQVAEQGKAQVYVTGDAFAAFIRGGGNVGLYAATSAALWAVYTDYDALSLLDVGVGDGMALLPALSENITPLTLIEPSAAMLTKTTAVLDERGIDYATYPCTLQTFMQREQLPTTRWDVIQATYSLQSLPPAERPAVFRWLKAHGARLLIAEFDVPDFPEMYHPARVRYIVARYQVGLAEYAHDGGVVAQGFLMPVLFGYFDRSAARTNWEGPIQRWANALREAGFQAICTHKLFTYFWADAYLIDAR